MKTTTFSRSSSLNKFGVLVCLAGLLLLAAPQVRADDEDTAKDPPKRVARISIVEGSVSLQPGGEGDWGSAAKNRPMTIGDKMWVDKDSRAELQAGEASFHLGSMTALSFLNLDEGITQVRVPEGAVNFRVRELRQGDLYEIDTPNAVFNVKQAGDFRIDVNEAGDASRITVIRGEGEVSAAGKTYEVHAGEQAEFGGTEDNPTYSILRAPGPDGLDKWAEERDLREDRSESGNYVSRDMPGYDDLDDHGTWSEQPEYGHVWYPDDVGPDWAPYSDGYWNWVAPWGWTWIDYSPWGFAPYHYGRWSYIGGRWGWCPGPYFGPPVYGPAFVGFLGGGFGFGFGVGFGVGWFPLGFGEPFFPWFGCSGTFINVINVHNTFIRNVNILNVNNIHNVNFVNAHNLRAVTTTSRTGFMNGERVNRGGQRLTQASLNGAKVTNSVGIRPTQHSTLGASNFNGHVARPSNAIQNRSVMARTAPARGASHEPVRTMNSATTAGRFGGAQNSGSARVNGGIDRAGQVGNAGAHNNMKTSGQFENRPGNAPAKSGNSGIASRQRELSQNRPPSAMPNGNRSANGPAAGNGRTWEAQGNATDRGRSPQGFGSERPSNAPAQNSPRSMGDRPAQSGSGSTSPHARTMSDRPPWAGNGGARSSNGVQSRESAPNYNGGGRSYEPPQRSNNRSYDSRGYAQQPSYSPRTYSSPGRSYPSPSRSYSPPPSRSYGGGGNSAPRSYGGGGSSAPRNYGGGGYSAPRSYAGGGGSPRSYGGGGGSYHGGGGSSGGSHGGGGYSGGGGHAGGGGGGHASSGGGGGASHGGGGGGHPHR